MYWLLIIGFVGISGSLVHGMMYEGMDDCYVKPLAAENLSIDLHVDGQCNSTSTSPLSHSPLAALTSPPRTFPLTPAEPTGVSPLFPGTPSEEELNRLLSPLPLHAPALQQQVQQRTQRFSGIAVKSRTSSSLVMSAEQQKLRTIKRRCCTVAGCLGASALAVAFVLVHKYTRLF